VRLIWILIALAMLLSLANAELDRGVKSSGLEDVILVGADDWHDAVAATPLAIWSEGNGTVTKPLLILPKSVKAGERLGWAEQKDLERYGPLTVLHTLASANITTVVIHGEGDLAKSMVEAAHKEGLEAYMTATLELPDNKSSGTSGSSIPSSNNNTVMANAARTKFLDEIGLEDATKDISQVDPYKLQKLAPGHDGNGSLLCPVNPDVRESLYNLEEELIQDYKVDGIVLYNTGFQNENFCFCDFCKEKFYKDTGIDLNKVYANQYNTERWRQWKEDQIQQIVRESSNITSDLGPVVLGVAIGSPFDRSQGYNYAEISKAADFMIISPLSPSDVKLASGMTDKPVYIRLSDDYVEYTLSVQNVEGTVNYIEDLVSGGARGMAFEYNIVYTPLWSELEPPSKSAKWLLGELGGKTLGIGNVSWKCDSLIKAGNSSDLASQISKKWARSPGAVLVGENYSMGLKAASLASYLNWPVLFVGDRLDGQTEASLRRLNASTVAIVGAIPKEARSNLTRMNLTIVDDDGKLMQKEMKSRGENITSVVLTNSHDLSLLQPNLETDFKRDLVGDIIVDAEISPSEIPAERAGETIRLNITLTNSGEDKAKSLEVVDKFPSGILLRWPKQTSGDVKITDPFTAQDSNPYNAFLDGSLLIWSVDSLEAGKSASLTLEAEVMYPLDAGWVKKVDSGATLTYSGLVQNITSEVKNSWPVMNITYPAEMPVGVANVSWEVAGNPSFTALKVFSPEGREGTIMITDIAPRKVYSQHLPLISPGSWRFHIEAGDGFGHATEEYVIKVTSSMPPINMTSFSHTKVPRLSLVAPQVAAARKALLVDVAKDPQYLDPAKAEDDMRSLVSDMKIVPEYLTVVGDPGSLPFLSTGITQNASDVIKYDVYRDYQIPSGEENYSQVGVGRILGLSVYDASQMVARTQAYDRIDGAWKNNALIISNPPLVFPQNPVPVSISQYLTDAGLNVKNLFSVDATYQEASSQMNNGQNIVDFDNHGDETAWLLSLWSLMDATMEDTDIKQLTLSPQTTTSNACLTSRIKGYTINVTGTEMYIPTRLEDSLALAFIRAGAVNYIGANTNSYIFLSDDYSKKLFQSLVFENKTVGKAVIDADNLYRMKAKGAKNLKPYSELDESYLPDWTETISTMYNQTVNQFMLFGDPAFKPYMPRTPKLPYTISASPINTSSNKTGELDISYTPTSEEGTDWLYWAQMETTDGELKMNSPPALIGQAALPRDADEVVIKENGKAVWHDEEVTDASKLVSWPVVRPRLNETRTFNIEYKVVPGLTQLMNITPGWNMVSLYVNPKDSSVSKYFKNKPYRGIFDISGDGWQLTMRDSGLNNVTVLQPGHGYLIDSSANFTVEIKGKPVEMPYRLQLKTGWNLVGVPFNQSVNISNITVNAEHKRYSFNEAIDKGIVSAFMWSFGDSDWNYMSQSDMLVPGKAYLVEAKKECRLEFKEK